MRRINLANQRYGKVVVEEPSPQRNRGSVMWKCRCDCGKEFLADARELKTGMVQSCGCELSAYQNIKNLTGMRFGRLTVLGKSGNRAKDRNPLWLCRCDCGNEVEVTKRKLVTGGVSSCGCKQKERTGLHFVEGTFVEGIQSQTTSQANTSGIRGAYFNKKRGKWVAQIMFKGKCYYLGGYDKLEDAAKARARGEEMFDDFLEWYKQEYGSQEQVSVTGQQDET